MFDAEPIIKSFTELVQITGPSLAEAPVVDYLKRRLPTLNIEYIEDDAAGKIGGNAGNLICRIPGNNANGIPIFLAAHMDTVQPCENVNPLQRDGIFKSDGSTILGADDRAGITAILEALRIVKQHNIKHGDIAILFTVGEEIGLQGAKQIDTSTLNAKMGFVLDCAKAEPGKLVVHTPTAVTFTITCKGKAAHAATAPEKGIHAIHFAAKAMARLKFGNVDKDTIVNIGTISGGSGINVIPDKVVMKGEVRSFSNELLNNHLTQIREAFNNEAKKAGGSVEFSDDKKYDGFQLSSDESVVKIAGNALRNLKLEPGFIRYKGGSDANVYNTKGIPTVNMGLGIANAHATTESIKVENIITMTKAVVEIIKIAADVNEPK